MITINYAGDDEEFPWAVNAGAKPAAGYMSLHKAVQAATVIAWYLTTGTPASKLGIMHPNHSIRSFRKRAY